MSKHTHWQVDDCGKGIYVETHDEIGICRILRASDWTLAQARQHARLIAAAPDLLEALMVAREAIVNDSFQIGWSVSGLDEAIAKATGETT